MTQETDVRPRIQCNIAGVIQSGWFYFLMLTITKHVDEAVNGASPMNGAFTDTSLHLREK